MARLTQLDVAQYPGVDAPLTLTFSPGTNVLYGPPSAARRRLLGLLCGVCTGSFHDTDQPLDLRATFAVPGGQASVSIRREAAGEPVVLVQDGRSQTLDAALPGAAHLIYDGTDALLAALGPSGSLRSETWLPPALAQVSGRAEGDGPVEVNLRSIPELSGLWWHLDYERGFLTLDGPAGGLGMRMIRDGVSRGVETLDAPQRRLLALFVYLSSRPVPFIAASLDGLCEEAVDDVLRHVEPPMFGGVPKRQSFFCAQTSTLMARMALKRPADVQQALVLCVPDQPWRKLTDGESRSYYQYFERGFRHIDSLMRLW
jgi:hypothetical protein